MSDVQLDKIDKKIIVLLQHDATLQVAEIAKRVGLSQTPCWKRIKRLEESGIIKARVAIIDAKAINASVVMFVTIKTNDHSDEWLENFRAVTSSMKEVVGLYRTAGKIDYLLKVVVSSVEAYDVFYKKLINAVPIYDVSAILVMETMKETTELPVDIELPPFFM